MEKLTIEQVREMMLVLNIISPSLSEDTKTPLFHLLRSSDCPDESEESKRGNCKMDTEGCKYFYGSRSDDQTYDVSRIFEGACLYDTYENISDSNTIGNCRRCEAVGVDVRYHYCNGTHKRSEE